jgi:hypothetical protein
LRTSWDWIYTQYLQAEPGLRAPATPEAAFELATHHLQAEPVCAVDPTAGQLPPIARTPSHTRAETRAVLGLAEGERMVLVTLGGMAGELPMPADGTGPADAVYVLPGASNEVRREGRRLLLPHHAALYHPNLIAASDAVVGKRGTARGGGVPRGAVGYVPRAGFRKSPVMAAFVQRSLPSVGSRWTCFRRAGGGRT